MTQTNPTPRFTAKEWNACGATQFYGKDRKRSYIVEVSLSEDIRGNLLQQAVDKTLRRLPYYGATFVRKKASITTRTTIYPFWWPNLKRRASSAARSPTSICWT